MSISHLSHRDALIVLAAIGEAGDRDLHALVNQRGASGALEYLATSHDDTSLRATARKHFDGAEPADIAAELNRRSADCGARVVIPGDDEWPSGLNDLTALDDPDDPHTRPPLCLWVRGPLHLARAVDKSVTIVGARCCTPYGQLVAAHLAYGLAQQDWSIVSGGSLGIDSVVHRRVLTAGGTTIAVLASGVDSPYPGSNAAMFDLVSETGLIVSEWPPGAIPKRRRFLVRNRCLAAMTGGTVVVEAALRSGARHTARRSSQLGRVVMIVPGPITSEYSAGVHTLARNEPDVRVVTSAADVIDDLTSP